MNENITSQSVLMYIDMYVDLCMLKFNKMPKGGRTSLADPDIDRYRYILDMAAMAETDPKTYIEGIVAEIEYEDISPVSVATLGFERGLELYRRYKSRCYNIALAESGTAMMLANKNVAEDQVVLLRNFHNMVRFYVSRSSRRPFSDLWRPVFRQESTVSVVRSWDDNKMIPISFKLIAQDWPLHGRAVPSVDDKTIKKMMTDHVVKEYRRLFPE